MRIEQLVYLIEISRSRSLNLAAEALHISTQALSASVKKLENELSTTILNRSNQGISFTDDGERVLHYAHTVVSEYQRLLSDLTGAQQRSPANETVSGTLHLLSAPAFLESLVPPRIQEFQQQYPNVKLSITQSSTKDICEAIRQNSASSLGLVLLPCSKDGLLRSFLPEGDFSFRPINVSRFVCCVPNDSPFARHKTISLNKALKQPLIIYTTGNAVNSPLLYQLRQSGHEIKIASVVSSINFWVKSIKNHLGIGFLNDIFLSPQSMVKDAFEDLVFIKIKEPLLSLNGFLYAEAPSPLAELFMNQFPTYHPKKNDPDFCSECMLL